MSDYRRNYIDTQFTLDEFGKPQGEPAYDAVTVISFDTDEELQRFLTEGAEHAEEFLADEFNFLDRGKVLGFTARQEVSQLPPKD